jgi:hypothetical protein
MRRRDLLLLLALPAARLAAAAATTGEATSTPTLRGKLTLRDGKPTIQLSDGRLIAVDGDEPTRGVLKDTRLAGADLEAVGHFANPGLFLVDPIYTRALHVYKDGKRFSVSYWCATCSIRTYTPGTCVCCQAETDLDLQDDGKK